MKIRYLLLPIIFIVILALLWQGLSLNPNRIPSPLINKPIPTFQLPELFNPKKNVSNLNFEGKIILLNVWASWCSACADEHALLVQLAKNSSITIYGLNYKDDPTAAKKWLTQYDNPYQMVAVDHSGDIAIDWGVYGTPETFLIDKKGIIRYKQIGPITMEAWTNTLKPLVEKIQDEK